MVAHFWIQDYAGMAWSAGTVGTGIMAVGFHVVRRLGTATLPRAVSAHIVLAFVNVFGAAAMGVLIGFDKVYHFLPGYVLANVVAHAHLAAIGWASMMVVGVAYRLLPMVLPAAMPKGRRLWISAVLLQTGVSGLFVTLLLQGPLAWLFALVVIAGFAAFVSQVAWMLRRPRLRCRTVRERCRMVFIHRHPRQRGECDPDRALRVSDAVFDATLNRTRPAMLMRTIALLPTASVRRCDMHRVGRCLSCSRPPLRGRLCRPVTAGYRP
ncbi:MAG: hypothetical protein A3H29_18580 [Acidobacteria bacterium RIFCSPLOWO2_02_FULL_67_21]|nr:MAG: hypothetical protein A3H29_18580 [Acidobacteria bacterium RIFCSPLOWO2_02_FULL_67_21]